MQGVVIERYGDGSRGDISIEVQDHNDYDVVDHDTREDVNHDHHDGESLMMTNMVMSMTVMIMPGENECKRDLLLRILSSWSMRGFRLENGARRWEFNNVAKRRLGREGHR